jgi:predicted Rossmann fold flavoprotein
MTTADVWDVAVVGAGAAGLFAAIRARELGARVVVLEKNRRPGVKILMSGGTRCNLTNARGLRNLGVVSGPVDPAYARGEARGATSIVEAFGADGSFLRPALRALGVDATIALFEAEGVATKIEANGKVFPVSDRAADVLAALVRRMERGGAVLRTLAPVSAIDPIDLDGRAGFRAEIPGEVVLARRVILAVGGQSYPGCGTTGDGYRMARRFGHTIKSPRPALVPLRVEEPWVAELSGVTVADSIVSISPGAGRRIDHRREAVLFTHSGFSGPAILDVSRTVSRSDVPLWLVLDWTPATDFARLDQELIAATRVGRAKVAALLPAAIPRRLADVLLDLSVIPRDRVGPELARDERQRLVQVLKGLRVPIAGTLGFEKAEVTSGGVALGEVEPTTLESRLWPGLYVCGELLDLDGRIGGYNFQAAWSTGWLAGERAADGARADRG